MQTIQILKKKIQETNLATITTYDVELPLPTKFPTMQIGFDAGTTHLGLAQIDPIKNTARLYEILMVRSPSAMTRLLGIQKILDNCPFYFINEFPVIIEGAAFGANYRQVELAEIRASAALWFTKYGGECYFVPPRAIRKQVFGNGNMLAHEYWDNSEIRNDALAALSCAYYVIT